jgi:hypothetical protein
MRARLLSSCFLTLAAALTTSPLACVTTVTTVESVGEDAGKDGVEESATDAASPPTADAGSETTDAAVATSEDAGTACTAHGQCTSGECNVATGTCKGAPGAACEPATGCASKAGHPFACTGGRCVGAIGAPCSQPSECASDLCNGACVGKTGDPCKKPADCASAICFYLACRADYGDACSDGTQCRPADLAQAGPDITVHCYSCAAPGVECTTPSHTGECLRACGGGVYRADCTP